MIRRLHHPVLLAALAAATTLGACASGGSAGAGEEAAPSARRSNSNRNLLTRDDLAAGPHTTLYDAARAMRAHWLRPGGGGASGTPVVYLEGQEYGNLESMRGISANTVLQARYLSTSEAQGKYGTRVMSPVIEVTLVKGQ